jgi:hypothetical protein
MDEEKKAAETAEGISAEVATTEQKSKKSLGDLALEFRSKFVEASPFEDPLARERDVVVAFVPANRILKEVLNGQEGVLDDQKDYLIAQMGRMREGALQRSAAAAGRGDRESDIQKIYDGVLAAITGLSGSQPFLDLTDSGDLFNLRIEKLKKDNPRVAQDLDRMAEFCAGQIETAQRQARQSESEGREDLFVTVAPLVGENPSNGNVDILASAFNAKDPEGEGFILSATVTPDGQRYFGAYSVGPRGCREVAFSDREETFVDLLRVAGEQARPAQAELPAGPARPEAARTRLEGLAAAAPEERGVFER